MTLTAAVTLAITFFVFGATPGPGIFAIIARALSAGFWSAFALILGLLVADVVWLGLSAGGLAALAAGMGSVFFVLKIAGGLYLAWLGFKAWRAPVKKMAAEDVRIGDADPTDGKSLLSVFGGGVMVNLSSPKSMVFYLAVLPAFMDPTNGGLKGALMVLAVAIPVLLGVATAYAFAASKARHLFRSDTAMRWLNRVSGTMLIGVGAAVAARS